MRPRFLLCSATLLAATACSQPDISVIHVQEPPAPDCEEQLFYADTDGDGFGNEADFAVACEAPDGFVMDDDDCDDTEAEVNPAAAELCNDIDDNCDAIIDDDAVDKTLWYLDADSDDHGDPAISELACDPGADMVAAGDDCDDAEPAVFPGADEICDSLDNNCDGIVDEDAIDQPAWYPDTDLDGYGDPLLPSYGCTAPTGWVDDDGDCNDDEEAMHPGHAEICDGLDNDCDGIVPVDETDVDGDGALDCSPPVVCTGTGMTWDVASTDPGLGTVKVACDGCDPYVGDTACTESRPVLCVSPRGLANPGITTDYYNGWVGGDVDRTSPVQGCVLSSHSAADALCEAELGPGWRMAEFHDGGGGWGYHGYGSIAAGDRSWTWIDDQPANCWD